MGREERWQSWLLELVRASQEVSYDSQEREGE
jgi:hypothetical protein